MSIERTEKTEAFDKYVDPIFIIQNELMFVVPKREDRRLNFSYCYRLENYHDEQVVRAGMCVALRERIEEQLSFEKTKELFKKEMHKVASNFDLDAIEMNEKKQKLEQTLFAHAKLQYCFDNYINKISLNNNISVLTCLMAIYDKVVKMKNEKTNSSFRELKDVSRSKWYRYVREAMLEEEGFDIKNYSKLSLQELSETLFNLVAECQYWLANSTNETMLTADKKNDVLEIFVYEEDNTYENFKSELEQVVWDWLVEEMHENQNLTTD